MDWEAEMNKKTPRVGSSIRLLESGIILTIASVFKPDMFDETWYYTKGNENGLFLYDYEFEVL